jgi:hypothetical protein
MLQVTPIMELKISIRGELKHVRINTKVIDRDIAHYEREGKVGKIDNGVYHAPRPDVHGHLVCLRDQRKYNPAEIEKVCMDVCHHNNDNTTDDVAHLDSCWKILEGLSRDGKVRYVEILD